MNDKFNKIIIVFSRICVCIYASIWLFNHVNAWLGILSLLLTIMVTGNYIIKKIKKN